MFGGISIHSPRMTICVRIIRTGIKNHNMHNDVKNTRHSLPPKTHMFVTRDDVTRSLKPTWRLKEEYN